VYDVAILVATFGLVVIHADAAADTVEHVIFLAEAVGRDDGRD
jgi:hypothetical protein